MKFDTQTVAAILGALGMGATGGGLTTNTVNEDTRALEIQAEETRFTAQLEAHEKQLERSADSYAKSLDLLAQNMRFACQ